MKSKFLFICAAVLFVANSTNAQTDTMYFFKNGTVIDKIATNTFDSITYSKKNPYLNPNINYGSVMDIDGNTYATVSIGSQVWMAENLKTTRYNDGTSVTYVSDNGTWTTTSSPAMCWYSNNIYYKELYGGLYNFYAVDMAANGNKNICPSGWHVPSDTEWTTLENYLIANGYNYDGTTTGNKIAKAITTATGWVSSSNVGTIGNSDYPSFQNKSGFSAFPGSYRNSGSGAFLNAGRAGYFWSSTQYDATFVWSRLLDSIYAASLRSSNSSKRVGLSVRCTKDN